MTWRAKERHAFSSIVHALTLLILFLPLSPPPPETTRLLPWLPSHVAALLTCLLTSPSRSCAPPCIPAAPARSCVPPRLLAAPTAVSSRAPSPGSTQPRRVHALAHLSSHCPGKLLRHLSTGFAEARRWMHRRGPLLHRIHAPLLHRIHGRSHRMLEKHSRPSTTVVRVWHVRSMPPLHLALDCCLGRLRRHLIDMLIVSSDAPLHSTHHTISEE